MTRSLRRPNRPAALPAGLLSLALLLSLSLSPLLTAGSLSAQEIDDAGIDSLMAPYSGDAPGGVVGVVREGELVFARGYGLADLGYDIPFTPETRTNIGSTTKQFTAFAIGLLAREGRLSLDDDVRDYIPELPTFDHTVTLRHLLTHTSGYREILNTLVLAGRQILEGGDHIARDEAIAVIQRQPALQNVPGAEWNYNNTAYALLSMVVERVTDTPFPDWMRDNVFLPLGMENTVVRTGPRQIVENAARGYVPLPEGGWGLARVLSGVVGAGGIYTTVPDLARWVENLETGRLGGRALIDQMTTSYVLTTGDSTGYGHGLFIDELRGLRRIHHGGADVAHRSAFVYFPEVRTAIIVLSNNASFQPLVADRVAEVVLGHAMEGPEGEAVAAQPGAADHAAAASPAPLDPAAFDIATFDRLAGNYAMDVMPSFVLSFFREDDTLYTQATGQPRVPMRPTSDSTYTLVGVEARVTFHRDGSGAFTHATLHQNGEHRATRVEGNRWTPSAAELEAYTGRYFSEELETYYTVVVEDGDLVIRHRRIGDVRLHPGADPDTFTGGFPVAKAEFERGEDGRVAALLVGNVRARGIRFVPVP